MSNKKLYSGLISGLIVKQAFKYFDSKKINYNDLLKKLPLPKSDYMNKAKWIDEKDLIQIGDFVYQRFGTHEIWYDITKYGYKQKKEGLTDSIVKCMINPKRLFKYMQLLSELFADKSLNFKVLKLGNNHCLMEQKRKKGVGKGTPGQYYSLMGNYEMFLMKFGCKKIKVIPLECYLPVDEMGPINGKTYKIKCKNVEEYNLKNKNKKIVGQLDNQRQIRINGTLYGGKRVLLDIRWQALSLFQKIKLLKEGYLRLKQLRKNSHNYQKKIQKKISEIKNINNSLNRKDKLILKINKQLKINNDKLRGKVLQNKSELQNIYIKLKETAKKRTDRELNIIKLKQEIVELEK